MLLWSFVDIATADSHRDLLHTVTDYM